MDELDMYAWVGRIPQDDMQRRLAYLTDEYQKYNARYESMKKENDILRKRISELEDQVKQLEAFLIKTEW